MKLHPSCAVQSGRGNVGVERTGHKVETHRILVLEYNIFNDFKI